MKHALSLEGLPAALLCACTLTYILLPHTASAAYYTQSTYSRVDSGFGISVPASAPKPSTPSSNPVTSGGKAVGSGVTPAASGGSKAGSGESSSNSGSWSDSGSGSGNNGGSQSSYGPTSQTSNTQSSCNLICKGASAVGGVAKYVLDGAKRSLAGWGISLPGEQYSVLPVVPSKPASISNPYYAGGGTDTSKTPNASVPGNIADALAIQAQEKLQRDMHQIREGLTDEAMDARDRAKAEGWNTNNVAVTAALDIALAQNGNDPSKAIASLKKVQDTTGVTDKQFESTLSTNVGLGLDSSNCGLPPSSTCLAAQEFKKIGITQNALQKQLVKTNTIAEVTPSLSCSDITTGAPKACPGSDGRGLVAGGDAETNAQALAQAQAADMKALLDEYPAYSTFTPAELAREIATIQRVKDAGKLDIDAATEKRLQLLQVLLSEKSGVEKPDVATLGVSDTALVTRGLDSTCNGQSCKALEEKYAKDFPVTTPKEALITERDRLLGYNAGDTFSERIDMIGYLLETRHNVEVTKGVGSTVTVTVPSNVLPGTYSLTDPSSIYSRVPSLTTMSFGNESIPQIGFSKFEGVEVTSIPAKAVKTLAIYDTSKIKISPAVSTPVSDKIFGETSLSASSFTKVDQDLKVILPTGQKPYVTENYFPVMSAAELLFVGKLDLTRGGKYNQESEEAALALALRGELPVSVRNKINKGIELTESDIIEMNGIATTLINRGISQNTSIEKIVATYGIVSSVTVDKKAFTNDSTGFSTVVADMVSGKYAKEFGLTNIEPDELAYATHYYSPTAILAENRRDDNSSNDNRSTPLGWDIDSTLSSYKSAGGHIFGNVLNGDGKNFEFSVADVVLPIGNTYPETIMLAYANTSQQVGALRAIDESVVDTVANQDPRLPEDGVVTIGANTTLADSVVRVAFDNEGIGESESTPGATVFGGLRAGTLEEILDLKKECNCEITVTGGTEEGYHSDKGTYTHSMGYKFDARTTPELLIYIQSLKPEETRGDGAAQYSNPSKPNVIYAIEGDHVDVTVKSERSDVVNADTSNTIITANSTLEGTTPSNVDDQDTQTDIGKVVTTVTDFGKKAVSVVSNFFESLVSGNNNSSRSEYTNLPDTDTKPPARKLSFYEIKQVSVHFGFEINCPKIQGVAQNPYIYTVVFNDTKIPSITRAGCGQGEPKVYAAAIAQDLEARNNFLPIIADQLFEKMTFNFYSSKVTEN